jgi:hypothetical protein
MYEEICGVRARDDRRVIICRADHCGELAAFENTLFALLPIKRTVPTTNTKMTASITAYSAISLAI